MPKNMMMARATTFLCRAFYADVIGQSYSPDELADNMNLSDSERDTIISASVMGIDKFAEDAHASVGNVKTINEQLAGVIEQVEVLNPQMGALTEGIEAQTSGAKQISDAIGQLNEAAQQTAESLSQTSSSISQLHQAALGLQEGASRFKVESDDEDVTSPV